MTIMMMGKMEKDLTSNINLFLSEKEQPNDMTWCPSNDLIDENNNNNTNTDNNGNDNNNNNIEIKELEKLVCRKENSIKKHIKELETEMDLIKQIIPTFNADEESELISMAMVSRIIAARVTFNQ